MRYVGGQLGQQAVGGVQLGGVGGGVDDGDDRVEAVARDVVRVPLAGAVGRVVVRGEDEAGADRVPGVVHGEHGRAGGGGVPHLGAAELFEGDGEPQRRVHQLLEAEDEDARAAAGSAAPSAVGQPVPAMRAARLPAGPVGRGEAVPPAVGQARRASRVHPGRTRCRAGARRCERLLRYEAVVPGSPPRTPPPAPAPSPGRPPAAVPCPTPRRPGRRGRRSPAAKAVRRSRSCGRAHVDEGDDHVVVAGMARVQVADGVEDRVAGRELVVDQDQRAVARQEFGDPRAAAGARWRGSGPPRSRPPRATPGDRAAGGVQVRGEGQAVGDRVAEAGRGLRVAEHHRPRGRLVAEQLPHAHARVRIRRAHTTDGRCGTCLPSTLETSRWARLGLRRRASPSRSLRPLVPDELDAQPLGDPRSRPLTTLLFPLFVRTDRPYSSSVLLVRGRRSHRFGRWLVRQPARPAVSRSTKPTSSRGDAEHLGPQQGALGPGPVRLHLVHLVRVRRAQHPAAAPLGPQDVLRRR